MAYMPQEFALLSGAAGLSSFSQARFLSPRAWQAGLVDRMVLSVFRCFFKVEQRQHYRNLPEGFAATAGVYTSPELLAQPQRFFRPTCAPKQFAIARLGDLPDGERLHVTFRSNYRTYQKAYQDTYDSFVGNETVHARFWRHEGPARPTVLCIHGWGGGSLWVEEQFFAVASLYQAGLDVLVISLPFHGPRRPAGRFGLNLFPSSDLRRTNEGFGQAIADVQALMQWVRQRDPQVRIGVVGLSLGGYVASLLASLDSSIDFVVPMIAPVSLADLVWNIELDKAGHRILNATGFDLPLFRESLAVHCPLSHQLAIPKERVLLVGGLADGLVHASHVIALWEHWGKPPIHWFEGGHCLHFGRSRYLQAICQLAYGEHPPKVVPATRQSWQRHLQQAVGYANVLANRL